MKNFLKKVWNYSPAQVVSILSNKFFPPKYLPKFEIEHSELERLRKIPRNTKGETVLMGKKISFIDSSSYLAMCDEIFVEENYKFVSRSESPLIIDCGSNIGISVIFFKLLYPKSRIIAFEPDKDAFLALKSNIESFGFNDIELNNKAVWTSYDDINFHADGSWGGKVVEDAGDNCVPVQCFRLRDALNRKIDFLKVNIEGAETDVIVDCADNLINVENIFIEYHSSVDKEQTLQKVLSVLSSSGMRYYIGEAAHRSYPFLKNVLSGFDLQLNISGYRKF